MASDKLKKENGEVDAATQRAPWCLVLWPRLSRHWAQLILFLLSAFCFLLLASCRQDMHVQPRYNPLEPSTFFNDGRSERPIIPGTVARGHLRADEGFYTGKVNGVEVNAFPFPVTRNVLDRGRERYNIYCTPCHDRTGDGRGMIVQRGFPPPPSYHIDRLRQAPVGHFYEVITEGYGTMYSYAARIPPQDRWAIVAYIRALQLSQQAKLADLSAEERQQLPGAQATGQPPSNAQGSGVEKK